MGGTKRMTKDEKRNVILGLYHKTQQVYTEKEMITLASKAGINAQTIPDIHQSLVDDALVEKQKIGGTNYCWSFKSKKDRMAQKQHKATLEQIEALQPKVEEAKARLADAKRGREEVEVGEDGGTEEDTRAAKLAKLSTLAQTKAALEQQLQALKENDPAALANLEKEYQLVRDAANRWTDNIFECKSYLVKKKGMDKKEVNKILGITANFDYPEEK
ncbi:unnamed protein product [Cylindrotheca closterium]|uniref:Meiotic nuclear division protein 1 homolog n=1 Tax=Cylindrotheca closterium TaxID=2856 RepID=A0AAD2FQT7_9STRA|nr:unnamed protein product [Cylindrotheca closterium]